MNTTNPYAPPQAAVQDVVESTADGFELAGRGMRLVAAILDGIFLVLMVYVPVLIGIRLNGHPLFLNANFNYAAALHSGAWGILPGIGLLAFAWINIVFVSRNGQSIAKKLMGIKVIRSDGSKAGLGRIFWLRNVIGVVLGFIPLLGMVYSLVDALLIFGQPRQCVHDKIADTIVIKA